MERAADPEELRALAQRVRARISLTCCGFAAPYFSTIAARTFSCTSGLAKGLSAPLRTGRFPSMASCTFWKVLAPFAKGLSAPYRATFVAALRARASGVCVASSTP